MNDLPPHLKEPGPHWYESDNYTVFDFETTMRGPGDSPLALYAQNTTVMVAWYNGPGHRRPGWHVSWGGELDHQELVDDVASADFSVAHNAKFDLQWLSRCGVDIAEVLVWDTMLADYVIGGNRWQWGQVSLESCAIRRGWAGKESLVSKMIKNKVPVEDIPRSWLQSYCIKDVDLTHRLFLHQREHMPLRLKRITFTRCILSPVLAEIEAVGMTLDPERVRARSDEVERQYAEVQYQIDEATGGINVNSGPQLSEFLYETLGFDELKNRRGEPLRTPKGGRKTDITTILSLKARTKRQKEFIALYKKQNALWTELSKYLRKFRQCVDDNDALLLAQFNQSATQTHRLSSSGLEYTTQFQNFPRVYKPMFRARKDGWYVGEADGAQLEFRVAGDLGNDSQILRDLKDEVDVHSVTSSVITESGQDTDRQAAKAHTFKPLYGGQSGTEAEQAYYRHFREKYGELTEEQQRWVNRVLSHKKLTTKWGLTFYWPDTRMDRSGYINNTPSICNYPVQSFATAEIIPIGLVYFWHEVRRRGLDMRVVNTIHDSIICEVPPWEIEEFHELSKYALIDVPYWYLSEVYKVQFTMPLGAGVALGEHWSDEQAKIGEVKYNASESLYAQGGA